MENTPKTVTITSKFAHHCAMCLVDHYNEHQGKTTGAVRLVAFRSLYHDLQVLGMEFEIANAAKPEDFPQNVWFIK